MSPVNTLTKINEFKSLLKNYKPDPSAIQKLVNTKLVILVGPTASGRNTLINLLVGTGRYQYVVSDTTRQPRKNNGVLEQHGVEYWFKTEERFLNGLKEGKYLEAAIVHSQQVSGISVDELDRAMKSGKLAIDELEVDGARTLYKYKKDALYVFLLPPSFDVWMERLHGRGDVNEIELRRRLKSAEAEISEALESDFYHFVINNEIHEATVAVDELANGREADEHKQVLGRNHAERLIIDVRLYLENR